jgi:hypothetical protein
VRYHISLIRTIHTHKAFGADANTRSFPMTDKQKNMARKIRGLLNLANDASVTMEEAAAAAAMAAELGLKYNIELDSLATEAERKTFSKGDVATKITEQRDRQAHIALGNAIAALYGCQVLLRRLPSFTEMFFVGQPHNIEMANTWARYLWSACTRANRAYAKERTFATPAERYRADGSFRMHFASEVSKRLYEKLAAMREKGTGESTALVVVNWFETERKEVAEWMASNMRLGKPMQSRGPMRVDYDAAISGREAGSKVGLSDQIAGKAASKRLA